MQRTHIYLPEELNREIGYIARLEGKTKAEITRKVLEEGLKTIKPPKPSSTKALLKIVREAKKIKGTAPRDLSVNHDYYTWGGPKRDPNAEI